MHEPRDMPVTGWLLLEGKPRSWGPFDAGPFKDEFPLDKVTIKGVYQNKPQCASNQITMKVEFEVNEANFLQGVATLKAKVPAPAPDVAEIQATVEVPVRGRKKSAAASVVSKP